MTEMDVRDRKTDKIYQAKVQSVDLNSDGHYVMRYIIGIQGYKEFYFLHAIYDNDKFNQMYEVVKWNPKTNTWDALR